MNTDSDNEKLQKLHYDKIMEQYELHYDDECSQKFRKRFIYDPMFSEVNLENKKVLEAMCGSGQTTVYLNDHGSQVTGLDISEKGIQSYMARYPNSEAICSSITQIPVSDNTYDGVVIIGGLHHLQPNPETALDEIYRVLKPGGFFCFYEPHQGSWPDLVRRFWYRRDPLFEKNEAAVDLDSLEKTAVGRFKRIKRVYTGNFGYLFILNSMIWRIPIKLKKYYTPLFLAIESLLLPLQGKRLSCISINHWVKT